MTRTRLTAALLGLSIAFGPWAAGAQFRDETPLADVLEVLVLDRHLVAIDAEGGGQTVIDLRLDEKVLWTGSRGKLGVVITDQRLLAVATRSAAWQQADYQRTEPPPVSALLGDRVALVTTARRIIGFNGGSGNLVETPLGLRETVLARRVGENAAVVVTDRRALGLSPTAGGFFPVDLHLTETIESVQASANFATVTTNRRVLIFRSPTGSWEERRRTLR
jgi:hypothetical protein